MVEFQYIIKDELGIHARPAGLLVREAAKYSSEILLTIEGKEASAKKMFAVMALVAKKGDAITVAIDGADENAAAKAMQLFLNDNL